MTGSSHPSGQQSDRRKAPTHHHDVVTWSKVTVILAGVGAIAMLHSRVMIPMTIDGIWPKLEARLEIHERHPHEGAVIDRDLTGLRAEIIWRLERLEKKVDNLPQVGGR